MKRLAMVLTVAFTMGLAASTVSASTVKDDKKKTECTAAEKKDCAKGKSCCADKTASTKEVKEKKEKK